MTLKLDTLNHWIPDKGAFLSVDAALCIGCGACTRVCVAGIWALGADGKARPAVDHAQRCLECGACLLICETEAVGFRYPAGGRGVVFERG